MRGRKFEQIKNYSKIMKTRRENGKIEEIQGSMPSSSMKDESKEQPEPIEFEEEFEDEFEEEEVWEDEEQEEEHEDEPREDDGTMQSQEVVSRPTKKAEVPTEVFVGTKKNLTKGEVLDFDNSAYDMLHRLNIEWPSLSIDFVCKDSPFAANLAFEQMKKYPFEVYTVQGSSNNSKNNSIYLTKWAQLHKTRYDDDPDAQGDEEDNEVMNDDQPQVIIQELETTYSVNRIRSLMNSPIVSFWNDQGEIHIMDLTKNFEKLKNNVGSKKKEFGQEIVLNSDAEGFGLAWNPHKIGQLVTGNTIGQVELFQNNESYTAWRKSAIYTYHKGSVEDVIFSPTEPTVFATCSSDGTLQIVDTRVGNLNQSQMLIKAHDSDVNVCDWNKVATNLIVTGSDDCSVKVWDLRSQKKSKRSEELLCFNWHSEPITSIRFQPKQQSVVAVASEDNSISIWDMAMENEQEDPEFPNELMFIHQGQEQIKELCYHPVYFEMVVSSASDGINIFKPCFEMPEEEHDCKEDLKRPPIREEDLERFLGRQ